MRLSGSSPCPLRFVLVAAALLFVSLFVTAHGAESEAPSQRVGLPLVLEDLTLPGPLLEPIPRKNRELPLIVRLLEASPEEGAFRYTFEVQGLDPGHYNLGDYLRLAESESGTSSHQIPLTIVTKLPPGLPQPEALTPKPAPRIGGYRALLWILGLVWIAGLAWIVFFKKASHTSSAPLTTTPTLSDRLKPLLKKASQGELSTAEQARLERMVLGHWRERVPEVADLPPARSLAVLRSHEEAAPLLLKLEQWLHAPGHELSSAEIEALLEPYHV